MFYSFNISKFVLVFPILLSLHFGVGAMSLENEKRLCINKIRAIDENIVRQSNGGFFGIFAVDENGSYTWNDPSRANEEQHLTMIRQALNANDKLTPQEQVDLKKTHETRIVQINAILDKREDAKTDVLKNMGLGMAQAIPQRAKVQEIFKQLVVMLQDPAFLRNAALATAVITAIVGILAATTYFGGKYFYTKAINRLGKPKLIRESSQLGLLESIFHTPEEVSLSDIVLAPEIEEAAHELAEATVQASEMVLEQENVILFGPPGTGKTEFARLLAKYSGMQYVIISGADIMQFETGEAVVKIHELFEWIERGKNPTIVFIDEADSFLASRTLCDENRKAIVNAFLFHTGKGSPLVKLILSTNNYEDLDEAVLSRFHNKIKFDLPGAAERYKILLLKLEKHIMTFTRKYEKDGEETEESIFVDSRIDDAFLKNVANQCNGLSGRDIENVVLGMRRQVLLSGNNILTPEIANKEIAKKMKEVELDRSVAKKQKQLYKTKTGVDVIA